MQSVLLTSGTRGFVGEACKRLGFFGVLTGWLYGLEWPLPFCGPIAWLGVTQHHE